MRYVVAEAVDARRAEPDELESRDGGPVAARGDLAGGVEPRPAHRLTARRKACTAWVSRVFERELQLPFGGEGISGKGREGGQYSREFFTEPRAVTLEIR
jgi:hypothetical protein